VPEVELTLDERHEVEDVVACLRAGALSWGALPFSGAVDQSSRPKRVDHVLEVAQEIEDESRRVHAAREDEHRRRAKMKR